MKKSILAFLVLGLALSGCVKKSQYEATAAKLKSTEAQLAESEANGQSLEEALAQEKVRVESLEAEIADLKDKLEHRKDRT